VGSRLEPLDRDTVIVASPDRLVPNTTDNFSLLRSLEFLIKSAVHILSQWLSDVLKIVAYFSKAALEGDLSPSGDPLLLVFLAVNALSSLGADSSEPVQPRYRAHIEVS
jgi:hypothetical protein